MGWRGRSGFWKTKLPADRRSFWRSREEMLGLVMTEAAMGSTDQLWTPWLILLSTAIRPSKARHSRIEGTGTAGNSKFTRTAEQAVHGELGRTALRERQRHGEVRTPYEAAVRARFRPDRCCVLRL